MASWFLTSELRLFPRERTVFSANGAGPTECLYAKEWIWTLTSYHLQKLTQIDQRPKYKS